MLVAPQFVVDTNATVRQVEEEDLHLIKERVLGEGVVPEDSVGEAMREYRRFMTLIALGNSGLAMCSALVDEVWHAHILFTKSYSDFCHRISGRFVHHRPATSEEPVSQEAVERFYRAYESTFGPVPAIWAGKAHGWCLCAPKPDMCDGAGNCDCGDYDDDDDDDD